MKTPADMLATDLRRVAGAIPVGWRAVAVMAVLIVVFPILISVFVLDALTYEMPWIRTPLKKAGQWMSAVMHFNPRRLTGIPRPQVRHAH